MPQQCTHACNYATIAFPLTILHIRRLAFISIPSPIPIVCRIPTSYSNCVLCAMLNECSLVFVLFLLCVIPLPFEKISIHHEKNATKDLPDFAGSDQVDQLSMDTFFAVSVLPTDAFVPRRAIGPPSASLTFGFLLVIVSPSSLSESSSSTVHAVSPSPL